MSGAATRWGAHLAQPLPEARRRCESSAAEGALGCEVSVDVAYRDSFPRMGPDYFLRLAAREGLPAGATVFVATDELDRAWFAPLREQGFGLRFADDLDRAPLLEALSSFPQAVWADVLAILEQVVCAGAPSGFVGSLPSTLSGHVVNVRAVARHAAAASGAAGGAPRPLLFTKLHESCCDARTEQDWVRGGLVGDGEPLPCVAREPWC
uniref:Uncharacterized protein n=1 Tax=Emiliania huxleyi TaxID=2903 RepID=A0A6V2SYF3_EMIHU|mmetsp:Transcript_13894/g.40972  ORF Transcript_13894/g.40972 Transcript_13894/m.40972 type:complete len:209 (-) Transcript_13894:15-641(-)